MKQFDDGKPLKKQPSLLQFYRILKLTAISILFCYLQVSAQVQISGKITDSAGAPIPGATVRVKGTSTGRSADANGNFTLSVPANAVLVVSSVGFESKEITVGDRTSFEVALGASKKVEDAVVVIGYGTASKRDLAGAVAKVSGKDVADKPNTNPLASLQGKVSGLSVVNSGVVGQEPDIRIRGTVSRTQTKPLYVVDGLFNDNINYINPADIESIEVLKDASSLAIFGVRGANGVIIVTTKKARAGQAVINLNSTIGVKNLVDKIKLTNGDEFRTLYDEQLVNQGQPPYDKWNLFNGNSDWIDLISQNGLVNTNNLSLSSGTDKNKFYMGLGYSIEEGLIKHEKLEKLILTINDELKVNKFLKFGFNFTGYRAKLPEVQARDFMAATRATPVVEAYNSSLGVYNKLPDVIGGPQIFNPLMMVEETKGTLLENNFRAVGSVFGEVDFLRHLNFRATYYGDLSFNDQQKYTPIILQYEAETDTVASPTGYTFTKAYQQDVGLKKYQQELLLTYKNKFGDHSITGLAGFTTYYNSYTETNGEVRDVAGSDNPIPRDKRFWYVDNFFGDKSTRIAAIPHGKDIFGVNDLPLEWEQTTVSWLFRALYNYKGKYILNTSFRRDGSSDISEANRYQDFWAVGAAWEFARENFMQNQKIFDYAKLKASWGVLGNQYTQIHYPFKPLLSTGQSYVFGDRVVPGYVPSFIADPNLKWETVESKEIGIELATLNSRLNVEFNVYNKLTDNLLTAVPEFSGQTPGVTNAGKIRNKGVEASATWHDKVGKNFSYTVSGNITTLNNEVTEMYTKGFEVILDPSRMTVGYPIGYFFGFIQDGIYQDAADKANSPDASALDPNYGPGDIKFKDIHGAKDANGSLTGPDGKIDLNDRTMIGNPTPNFIYGFALGAAYKGLDFGIDFQGSAGNEIFRNWGNGASYAPFNYREARLGRWHGAGTSNHEPQLNDQHSINRQFSTYMIEDGSYLRIRNIQFGYNFNSAFLTKIHIKALRVFVNGQNVKTFKHNSGFQPEFGGDFTTANASPAIQFGLDNGSYPLPAIYTFGINVTF